MNNWGHNNWGQTPINALLLGHGRHSAAILFSAVLTSSYNCSTGTLNPPLANSTISPRSDGYSTDPMAGVVAAEQVDAQAFRVYQRIFAQAGQFAVGGKFCTPVEGRCGG